MVETTAKKLPGSLKDNPRLGQWLTFKSDGTVEVYAGKIEIGQGILTALRQIVADELDIAPQRLVMMTARTGISPNEGVTSGSKSIEDSGSALRAVAAEARAIYLAAAAKRLGVPVESLSIDDGIIRGPGNATTSYAELADPALLDREATAAAKPKTPEQRRVVGKAEQRIDIPDKAFGRPRFVHDVDLGGVLHGRVLRPAAPGAKLLAMDDSQARGVPGVVAIVRDGSFVGLVAETENAAVAGLAKLSAGAQWTAGHELPDESALADWLKRQPAKTTTTEVLAGTGETPVKVIRREFSRPYISHGSMGPCCAVATWTGKKLSIRTHSQGVYNLRRDLEFVFKLAPDAIEIAHGEGPGCYGHNASDDVALDAALLARAVPGKPVRVLWTRADEFAWGPQGAPMAIAIEAGVDGKGEVASWTHEVWSNGFSSRPGRGGRTVLLAAAHMGEAPGWAMSVGDGAERNAAPDYALPGSKVIYHRLQVMPLRVSSLRSLGAHGNGFAIEQMFDEIAHLRGEDPVAARLRLLPDPRARAVVEATARRAGWTQWKKRDGLGHGIGFARYKGNGAYCAAVAEIEVETEIRVRRLVIGVDVGEVINPDGVINQIEGGAIQTVSWTLMEAVRFDRQRVTSDSWEAYPILRFSQVPAIEVEIVNRPDQKPLGAGEATQGPVAGAIGNALFDALGVRVRDMPLTPERIRAAIEAG